MVKILYKNFEKAIICLSPFLILLIFYFTNSDFCLFKMIFGIKCPGCGMTHAIASLIKGDFRSAMNYNPRVIIVFPILLYVWLKCIYTYIFKEHKKWALFGSKYMVGSTGLEPATSTMSMWCATNCANRPYFLLNCQCDATSRKMIINHFTRQSQLR